MKLFTLLFMLISIAKGEQIINDFINKVTNKLGTEFLHFTIQRKCNTYESKKKAQKCLNKCHNQWSCINFYCK